MAHRHLCRRGGFSPVHRQRQPYCVVALLIAPLLPTVNAIVTGGPSGPVAPVGPCGPVAPV